MKKVLVIITVYNDRHNIIYAITSVLNQTHKNWTLVIVDDASTDGTTELLSKLNIPNVVILLNKENKGTYSCLNDALILDMDWDFFTKVDADDYITPDRLEKQLLAVEGKGPLHSSRCRYYREFLYTGKRELPKFGDSMAMFSRRAFMVLGLFNEERSGSDTDYINRFNTYIGNGLMVEVYETLYQAIYKGKGHNSQSNKLSNKERLAIINKRYEKRS